MVVNYDSALTLHTPFDHLTRVVVITNSCKVKKILLYGKTIILFLGRFTPLFAELSPFAGAI
jgi:hypothetical protein